MDVIDTACAIYCLDVLCNISHCWIWFWYCVILCWQGFNDLIQMWKCLSMLIMNIHGIKCQLFGSVCIFFYHKCSCLMLRFCPDCIKLIIENLSIPVVMIQSRNIPMYLVESELFIHLVYLHSQKSVMTLIWLWLINYELF